MVNRGTILNEFTLTCKRPISEKEKTFEERSRSILSSVSAFLKGDIRTDGIWKISICLNSNNPLQHMKVVGGVLKYNASFNVDKFLAEPVSIQKEKMLDFILESLLNIFKDCSLDDNRLHGLRDFISERGFKSVFTGPLSTLGNLDARVVCEQEFDETNVFLSIWKDQTEIEKTFVLSTSPEEFIFGIYLKKPVWVSELELNLVTANNETFSISRSIKA